MSLSETKVMALYERVKEQQAAARKTQRAARQAAKTRQRNAAKRSAAARKAAKSRKRGKRR